MRGRIITYELIASRIYTRRILLAAARDGGLRRPAASSTSGHQSSAKPITLIVMCLPISES